MVPSLCHPERVLIPDSLRLGCILLIERPRPGVLNVLATDADEGVIILAFALDRWCGFVAWLELGDSQFEDN